MSSSNDREARRRRIAERGADRLALITGRIQSLPDTSSPPQSHDKIDINDAERSFKLPHNDFPASSDSTDGESKAESLFPKLEMSRETSKASDQEQNVQLQSSRVPQIVQQDFRAESWVSRGKLFTPKQINSAIAATESTRLYCSVAVAILVFLSYIGFPLLANSVTKSIITYRPLYLVLITGISVVFNQLLLDGRGVKRPKQEISKSPLVGEFGSAAQLAKILELGLCLKNISNAVFMDVSVYVIVIVCSLAFAQKLG